MNCYEILGITPNADLKDINSAYKRLALKYHPDKTGADDGHLEFQKIQQAVEILRDSTRRGKHDAELLSRRNLRDQAINLFNQDTSWGWAASSPDLSALRSMSGRYMFSYANSVHMDPYSPESRDEIRRCEREREYGEQLKRECEQWEAYEGNPDFSGYTWTYDPETEEMMRQNRRKEVMRARVMRDEEQTERGEMLDEEDEQEGCAEEGGMASTNPGSEFGEELGDEEYPQYEKGEEYEGEEKYEGGEEYEEQEDDEGYEEYYEEEEYAEKDDYEGGDGYDPYRGNDQEGEKEEKDDSAFSITSTQQTQAEYESARQAPVSDSEDLLDMTSVGEPVNPVDETGIISEESDTDENETFHSFSDGGEVCFNDDNVTSQATPADESSPSPRSLIDPLIPHFKEKLNHPSGQYTEEDIHTELRGLVMESFCGWLETLRLEFPGAESAATIQVNPEHCRHLGYWNKEFGSSECEVCHRWMPIYTLSCPGCGIRACVGCKFHYEE
ncbi:DnaJ domain protein [Aspergillus bombycis]|uniref:DnaJ domain protein n=1 Tax=Aspergillus bombycis TaxID=109264 RepID=A0A1F8A1E2_9EURO|nr:DnaJ domain protein [Aspergillus bombycis]OGM45550.1 DnaJ domain protein [Aspergillus bombycis]